MKTVAVVTLDGVLEYRTRPVVPRVNWKCVYFPYWFILWNVSELLDGVSEHKMAARGARKFEKVGIYFYCLYEFFW
jgi:hypothetical protein